MDLGEAGVGELGFGALEERRDELRPLLRGALRVIERRSDSLAATPTASTRPRAVEARVLLRATDLELVRA